MLKVLLVGFLSLLCSITCEEFDVPAIYQLTEPVDHAEEPTWDIRKNILFYVDMHSGRIFSYNYNTTEVNYVTLDGDVTPVIPSQNDDNLLIVGLNRTVLAVEWDGTNELGEQKVLSHLAEEYPTSRVNEGKADKQGRLWIGTMGWENETTGAVDSDQGILYKITKNTLENATVEIAPVNISNGLAWNAANDKFYYIDSLSLVIAEYDYNDTLGTISNRRVAFDVRDYPELAGHPDGMTIDEDDNLWVAMYYGGVVLKVNPTNGTLLQVLALPARDVTSTMWGGPNLDILFVTTSRISLTDEEKLIYPAAGSLFAVTNLKTKGRPVGADFDVPALYQLTEPVDHSEEPTWDGRKNILFYVDIHSGRIFSYNYNTTEVNYITLDGDVTPVVPAVNNSLLIVGLNRSVLAVEWDGTNELGEQKVLANISEEFPTSRVNDGKADKEGRLWIGTMGYENITAGTVVPNAGIFYKITKDTLEDPTVEIAPVNVSNGLAWNAANDKFYYVDSPTRLIASYDYNDTLGTISNRQVAFDMRDHPELAGHPDGMTIDEDDNLWVALAKGGAVLKINPTNGTLLQVIALPARDITSTMWGGPDLDILFVTTSRIALTDDEKLIYPAAGSLFAITNLKTKGRPVFNADLVDSI
ncbi:hypothetical protein YQE_00382, partial [Dendroctonus ponderosae]